MASLVTKGEHVGSDNCSSAVTLAGQPSVLMVKASSGVNWSAGPIVEAERLHDGERGGSGEHLDVGGGQHAGVLGDDGRGSALGDGVEVGFDPGPEVLPVVHVEGHREHGRAWAPTV